MAGETPYKKHFRKMMSKEGYSSPGDIPSGEKKTFFAKVDRSWHAKDEHMNKAQHIRGLVEEMLPLVDEGKALAAGAAAAAGAGLLLHHAHKAAHGVANSGLGTIGKEALRRKMDLDSIK